MKSEKAYFEIKLDDLRALGAWAADCAERVLPLYEAVAREDGQPRLAIEAAREFAGGGKRSQGLRKLAMDAYRASLEAVDEAAAAAARSASLAAASAFTHPFRDMLQARHILGPAAFAALAAESAARGDQAAGRLEVERAIAQVPEEVAILLGHMPFQEGGAKRIDQLYRDLDRGIRAKFGLPASAGAGGLGAGEP